MTSTQYELNPSLRAADGQYDYAFKTFVWDGESDIFSQLLNEPSNLAYDPSHIGVFDWANGALTREETLPAARMDMAFYSRRRGLEKDRDRLNEVFSGAIMFPVILLAAN